MAVWRYFHLSTQATFQVASAPCSLISVTVNKGAAAAVVNLFDGGTNGNTIAAIDASAAGNFFYGAVVPNQLVVQQIGGSADVTVIYQDELGVSEPEWEPA